MAYSEKDRKISNNFKMRQNSSTLFQKHLYISELLPEKRKHTAGLNCSINKSDQKVTAKNHS